MAISDCYPNPLGWTCLHFPDADLTQFSFNVTSLQFTWFVNEFLIAGSFDPILIILSCLPFEQELALKRTREAKEHAQECISNMYEGRPVNIIGTINTVLGLT